MRVVRLYTDKNYTCSIVPCCQDTVLNSTVGGSWKCSGIQKNTWRNRGLGLETGVGQSKWSCSVHIHMSENSSRTTVIDYHKTTISFQSCSFLTTLWRITLSDNNKENQVWVLCLYLEACVKLEACILGKQGITLLRMRGSMLLKKHFSYNIFLIFRDGSILKLHCCIPVWT